MTREKERTKNTPAVRKSTALVSISDLVEEFDDNDIADQQASDSEFGGGRANYHRWGPKNIVRLCPKRRGSKIMFKKGSRHFVADAGEGRGRPVACVAELRPPGRCFICEVLSVYAQHAKKKKDRDECNSQKARQGAYWNVIDMENPERGALLSWMPISIHNWIEIQTGYRDGEIEKRPWALDDGFPIKVDRNSDNKYDCRFLEKKAGRLEDECYLGMMDLEEAARAPTPQECFRIAKHMAENYDLLEYMDWDDVDLDDDQVERAKKSSKTVKRKPKDEDDDDDFEPVKGRTKSRVVVEEEDDEDEDEEEEKPKKAKKKEYIEPIIEVPKTKKPKKSVFDETEDDDDPWDEGEDEKPKKKSKR